jgi:putative membrane protein insertion efficiency factor
VKTRLWAAIAIVLIAIALDLRREPGDQLAARAAVGAIHAYQATLSPLYARMGARCRFTLSCSHYGEDVIRKFGLISGGWMAAKRVFRCGPWTPAGSVDLPPA